MNKKKDWLAKALEKGELQKRFDIEVHVWPDGLRITKLSPRKEAS